MHLNKILHTKIERDFVGDCLQTITHTLCISLYTLSLCSHLLSILKMQTRSKTAIPSNTLAAKESSFETRRSRRLVLVEPTVANVSAIEVADWLSRNAIAVNEYDSDNDSTSTYNTEDAEAEFAEDIKFNQTQTHQQPNKYVVEIDFDEASNAWKANKRSIGNGSYRYTRARSSQQTATVEATKTATTAGGVRTRSQIKKLFK